MPLPEQRARENIDALLTAAGWQVQDVKAANLHAGRGVAVREFKMANNYDGADYLLFVDGRAAGVVEAKPEGYTLTGVEVQSEKYSVGIPNTVQVYRKPLPFVYQSTGVETFFTNGLDPEPRSRQVFSFHRPATLAVWLGLDPTASTAGTMLKVAEDGAVWLPSTYTARMANLPPIAPGTLWRVQLQAVEALERSMAQGRRRALVQMATGSGKTFTAITAIYRMLRYGNAKRVLFLVDRNNLGRQAKKEFDAYELPGEGRKFTEVYNVQHMASNRVDSSARVCICTIQRLFSMLKGEAEFEESREEGSQFDAAPPASAAPAQVGYNPQVPIETFDIIFTDECHRSIYSQWRQVLEYFDASLVGLTATPSAQTLGFFDRNLVMEYNHQQAVVDGVNVDFGVYRIRTQVTEQGGTVGAGEWVDLRDRRSRKVRWQQLTDDLQYRGKDLDRAVVVPDQIRTVIRTFKERVCTEIFPGRKEVPKTLIFAKDDSHADDIVRMVRDEFGRGNDFCEKITYTTPMVRKVDDAGNVVGYEKTGKTAEGLLQAFRNTYYPRVVVTVDMIATGTDVKPLEIVMFMRAVKSRSYFQQMIGRGVRVASPAELQQVNPEGVNVKDNFMVVDCVGLDEDDLVDTEPLDRDPSVPLPKLLQQVALGHASPDMVATLANRLVRLERQLTDTERQTVRDLTGGPGLLDLVRDMVEALDPDRQELAAATMLPAGAEPTDAQIAAAAQHLLAQAVKPLAEKPELRDLLVAMRGQHEQTIDRVTADVLLEAGVDAKAREQLEGLVRDFRSYLEEHRDEITALQVLYSRPYRSRPTRQQVQALANALQAPPRAWTPAKLWNAYAALHGEKVKGTPKTFTDIVALVQYALQQEDELRPFPETVEARYERWLAQQASAGAVFTADQRWWLDAMKDQIAANLEMTDDDFEETPFAGHGGIMRAYQVFGDDLERYRVELNEALVA